jgi:hypothetical protein
VSAYRIYGVWYLGPEGDEELCSLHVTLEGADAYVNARPHPSMYTVETMRIFP